MTTTTTPDKLALVVADLAPASAASLRAAFGEMFTQAEEWAAKAQGIIVTRADQTSEMELARESRLALRSIRIKVEAKRKDLKEDSLRRGQAIDGIARVIRSLVEPIEAHLLEQEEFVERQAAAEAAKLRQLRVAALASFGADPSVYADIGGMSDAAWAMLLNGVRLHHEAQLAADKLEREAQEKARLAKEAEDVKVRVENARLKKEAEILEAKNKAVEKKLADTRAANARRIAEEVAAEKERKIQEAEAAQAPDREKLGAFARSLRALPMPAMRTAGGRAAQSELADAIELIASRAETILLRKR